MSKITFKRFGDSELGPRKFPSPETFEKTQPAVDTAASLTINLDKSVITLVESGKEIDIANRLIYQVV